MHQTRVYLGLTNISDLTYLGARPKTLGSGKELNEGL